MAPIGNGSVNKSTGPVEVMLYVHASITHNSYLFNFNARTDRSTNRTEQIEVTPGLKTGEWCFNGMFTQMEILQIHIEIGAPDIDGVL